MPTVASAQSGGTRDINFFTGLSGFNAFAALYIPSYSPYILVGGDDGVLTEVNANDGSTSSTFVLGAPLGSVSGRITYALAAELATAADGTVAPDGKILVGGLFGETTIPGGTVVQAANIGRLLSGGTVDTTFNPGNGADDSVFTILPLPDGTSIIGGAFNVYNSGSHRHIAKIDTTGAAVSGFAPSMDDNVIALASQIDGTTNLPNGQILACGTFSNVSGVSQAKLVRLNADGSVDKSFRPTFDTRVLAVAVQKNGKIVVGGQFATADGVSHIDMARLNQDGSIDPTFSAVFTGGFNSGFPPTAVYKIILLPHGQMLVGGNFTSVNGTPEQYLTRLFSDGSVDPSFNTGTTILNSVQDLVLQPDGNIVVTETFSKKINNIPPDEVIRVYGGPAYQPPPKIYLDATRPSTSEADGPKGRPVNGVITVRRGLSGITQPITVFYTVGGSAVAGRDYRALSGQVVIPANLNVVPIRVRPLGDDLGAASADVTITLSASPDDAYRVATPTTETVTIANK